MSKVNCEAVGKCRQASLRMARAELLQQFSLSEQITFFVQCFLNPVECLLRSSCHGMEVFPIRKFRQRFRFVPLYLIHKIGDIHPAADDQIRTDLPIDWMLYNDILDIPATIYDRMEFIRNLFIRMPHMK